MEDLLCTAERAFKSGHHQEALEEYVQAAVQWPSCKDEIRPYLIESMSIVLDQIPTFKGHPSPVFLKLVDSVHSLYSNDPLVAAVLGTRCLNEGAFKEAELYLGEAVTFDPTCVLARENLSIVREHIIHRWHFRMLNDLGRNSAYFRAIHSAVNSIPDCTVLDIGSGTGLLSMMAVRSGAKSVYACELNETMATMSRDILSTNGMGDDVHVLNAISTDLSVPKDLPNRVSLVVTETVDAGLLGEGIVPSLRHAWSDLLLPRQPDTLTNENAHCGHVIPCGAMVYATLIECIEVRKQSRLLSPSVAGVSLDSVRLEGSCCAASPNGCGYYKGGGQTSHTSFELTREPYTCERLSSVRGGYRELSETVSAMEFDFTQPQLALPQARHLSLPITTGGTVDAIAVWFNLHLDPANSILTSPSQDTTWEQALFPLVHPLTVCEGDLVTLCASCSDTRIDMVVEDHVTCPGNAERCGTINESISNREAVSAGLETYFIERSDLLRLNDNDYMSAYHRAIVSGVRSVCGEEVEGDDCAKCVVLDLTQGMSLFGLTAANQGADFVVVAQTPPMYKPLIGKLIETNNPSESVSFRYQNGTELIHMGVHWDVVISDIVSPQGTLRSGVLEELGTLRSTCPDCLLIPSRMSVCVILLSSPSLRACSSVLGTLPTLGFNIAGHMNTYQVTHYTDIDLNSVPHQILSSRTEACIVDLGGIPTAVDQSVCVPVTDGGIVTGLGYWFQLHLHGDITIQTGPSCGHWHQCVFMLPEDVQVSTGQVVTVHVAIKDSCIFLELLNNSSST